MEETGMILERERALENEWREGGPFHRKGTQDREGEDKRGEEKEGGEGGRRETEERRGSRCKEEEKEEGKERMESGGYLILRVNALNLPSYIPSFD